MEAYVTNLGKYNEGKLIGKWAQFPMDEEEFTEALKSIGVQEGSAYEEYFITDYETSCVTAYEELGEYPNLESLNELAELDNKIGENEALQALIEAIGNIQEAYETFKNERYVFYKGQTLEDVAYELVQDREDLSEFARRYFDYKSFANDLSYEGYDKVENGVIYYY